MKSTHTVTYMSIFLGAGNWSCLIITTDLIRAGLLIHSSLSVSEGFFQKLIVFLPELFILTKVEPMQSENKAALKCNSVTLYSHHSCLCVASFYA